MGNFSNIYATGYVYCNSNLCGQDYIGKNGDQDGSGSGQKPIEHAPNRGGQQDDAVRMQGYFKPLARNVYDYAKTATARCGTGENFNCKF